MNDNTKPEPLKPKPFSSSVLYDMTAREYHAIEAMSASAVSHLLRSPAHYRAWINEERTQSEAMLLGELIHMGILEPERFQKKVWVWEKPQDRMSPTERKSRDEEHQAATLAGNLVVEKALFQTAIRCIYAVKSHPKAAALLDGAKTEVTILWDDPKYRIPCKARLDVLKNAVICDIKSSKDASRDAFMRTAASYNYHAQGAMYCVAHEVALDKTPDAFVWIVVETDPPYGVAVYAMGVPTQLAGRSLVAQAMSRYSESMRRNDWLGYSTDITVLDLPRWKLTEVQY